MEVRSFLEGQKAGPPPPPPPPLPPVVPDGATVVAGVLGLPLPVFVLELDEPQAAAASATAKSSDAPRALRDFMGQPPSDPEEGPWDQFLYFVRLGPPAGFPGRKRPFSNSLSLGRLCLIGGEPPPSEPVKAIRTARLGVSKVIKRIDPWETGDMNAFQTGQDSTSTVRRYRARSRALLTISGLFVIASIAAACGSSTKSSTSSSTSAAAPASGASAATPSVETATNAKLGTILVDSKGFTLYTLNKDSTNKSVCGSDCQKIWPLLLLTGSGTPVGGPGVTGLGTIRTSGAEQITYKGMPLYTYTGDTSPGQILGQNLTDTWGTWFVVVTNPPAAAAAPATSPGAPATSPATSPAAPATTPTTLKSGSGGGGPAF